ncbi:LysR family transcriptional regulator [Pandoraea iniqua]|uniref:LysR family transcriptional regulator n=1 Tax=Pandoraea iniqua TaxID=2508288 RepID=A0A5E4V7T0_9BURK|nr:LysR family transcriptional regulator [Pandoraea iniqua]VVE08161.1 LysR family transcriptional regulator [Pandoraea iniqua]VVE34737.1 LysR family transcriptional regulator [Pandoraea iniqua]
MNALDIDAVRAFVLTVELKSFTRAAEVLNSTQSAVSVKIKRLEAVLGHRLLDRTPRQVRLSASGLAFLAPARALVSAHETALQAFSTQTRRLTIGISHHLVGANLPLLIRRMHDADPGVIVELRIAPSRELLEHYDATEIDACIVLRHDTRRLDGERIMVQSFGWMAATDFEPSANGGLPLATQAKPCSVRAMAVSALDAAGVAWHEVFVGGGVGTIGAAVTAGLAVAALAHRVAPAGTVDVGQRLGLPPLPVRDVVMHTGLTDAQARRTLQTLSAALRTT